MADWVILRLASGSMANLFEPPRYIAIEGPIRVGKSTLARIIAERMRAQQVSEPGNNSFHKDFYGCQCGAAFQAQLVFMASWFELYHTVGLGDYSCARLRVC